MEQVRKPPVTSPSSQRSEHAPPLNSRRRFSICELPRDQAWERRRIQFLRQARRRNSESSELLTDEDLNELKGCIELGFGFSEENGQNLCSTIPALDLYFAVNRQFSCSPVSSPGTPTTSPALSPCSDPDSWKIISPGEDPRQVKTKLRHWAQAVACSLKQSSS